MRESARKSKSAGGIDIVDFKEYRERKMALMRKKMLGIVFLGATNFLALPSDALATPGGKSLESNAASSKPGSSEMILLEIDKTHLTAKLRTLPAEEGDAFVIENFPIAIGKEIGDKVVEGDNRTPEGIFFALNHIDGDKLPPKYGPGAIPLDYPNEYDRAKQRTGHGIWLHGVDAEDRIVKERVTEGCVALHNEDVKRLTKWLEPHQAIVVIANDAAEINGPESVEQVKKATDSWIAAWRARDITEYRKFYSSNFSHANGKNPAEYANYKKGIFSRYREMKVGIEDLRIVTHPKYAISVMNQDFFADSFRTRGRKVLYWERDSATGDWKILREYFGNIPLKKRPFADFELAKIESRASAKPQTAAANKPGLSPL